VCKHTAWDPIHIMGVPPIYGEYLTDWHDFCMPNLGTILAWGMVLPKVTVYLA